MDPISFDDTLFQRGLTWSECLASWRFETKGFRRRVLPTQPPDAMSPPVAQRRLMVYYHPQLDITQQILPMLGPLLQSRSQLDVRYFDQLWFFSLLYPRLGRTTPRILALDAAGGLVADQIIDPSLGDEKHLSAWIDTFLTSL